MIQTFTHKRIGKFIFTACLLSLLQVSCDQAEENDTSYEEIIGEWQIKYNNFSVNRFYTLSFSKKRGGSLSGKCGSRELADVRFENGELSYTLITPTRVRDFEENFNGILEDGKFTGIISGDTGNFPAIITRKRLKSLVLGQWDIKYNFNEQEINSRLTISEDPNGILSANWDTELGEHDVSNVNFQDGKLTFSLSRKVDDLESELTFNGTIKEHELFGVLKSQQGEIQVKGERFGAVLVGKWELTENLFPESQGSNLYIAGDLSGSFVNTQLGVEMPITNLKLEADLVSFIAEIIDQDGNVIIRTDFKGKLDEDYLLRGELEAMMFQENIPITENRGQVTVKRVDASPPLMGSW